MNKFNNYKKNYSLKINNKKIYNKQLMNKKE